jgi:hypothetical protein
VDPGDLRRTGTAADRVLDAEDLDSLLERELDLHRGQDVRLTIHRPSGRTSTATRQFNEIYLADQDEKEDQASDDLGVDGPLGGAAFAGFLVLVRTGLDTEWTDRVLERHRVDPAPGRGVGRRAGDVAQLGDEVDRFENFFLPRPASVRALDPAGRSRDRCSGSRKRPIAGVLGYHSRVPDPVLVHDLRQPLRRRTHTGLGLQGHRRRAEAGQRRRRPGRGVRGGDRKACKRV